jgi:DinB superfamily
MSEVPRSEQSQLLSERMKATHLQLQQDVAALELDAPIQPREGEWSAGEVLAHVPEFLRYWAGEVERLKKQPGAGFGRSKQDPARVGWVADRGALPLRALIEDLNSAVDDAVASVASLTDADLQQTGVHFHRGRMTVLDVVVTFLVEHLEEHQLQLRAVVEDGDRQVGSRG